MQTTLRASVVNHIACIVCRGLARSGRQARIGVMSSALPVLSNLPHPPRSCPTTHSYETVRATFEQYLHGEKLKFTPERAMMLDAVLRKAGPFEPEQLVKDLQDRGGRVSRATVYRTFGHLQGAGIIRQVCFGNRQCLYEVATHDEASDHLMCAVTGKVLTLDSEKLQRLCEEICLEHGFELVSHQVRILGISPEGKAAAAAGAAPVSIRQGCDRNP